MNRNGAIASDDDIPRAVPILRAFQELGFGPGKGAELVRRGELKTFLIGRCRYTTPAAMRELLDRYIAEAAMETPEHRAKRTAAATTASLRARGKLAA